MFLYIPVRENLYSPDIGYYDTYKVISFRLGSDNSWNEELSISDISVSKNFVYTLVALCNLNQLDPIHFFDLVEDIL